MTRRFAPAAAIANTNAAWTYENLPALVEAQRHRIALRVLREEKMSRATLKGEVIDIPPTGSRWREVDPRFGGRIVEVVFGFDVVEKKVRIRNTVTGRITWARIDRFNGKRGGYARMPL